jgi:hypothetical protein
LSEAEKQRRQTAGLPPEPEKPPEIEVKIDLVGTAINDSQVTQYVSSLNKSALLSDVNLLLAEEAKRDKSDDSETIRKFHVEMKINPKADLRQLASGDALSSVKDSH